MTNNWSQVHARYQWMSLDKMLLTQELGVFLNFLHTTHLTDPYNNGLAKEAQNIEEAPFFKKPYQRRFTVHHGSPEQEAQAGTGVQLEQ